MHNRSNSPPACICRACDSICSMVTSVRSLIRRGASRKTLIAACSRPISVSALSSSFGRCNRTDRDGRPFLPGLDWLVMPKNFAKVIEGRYHDRSAA